MSLTAETLQLSVPLVTAMQTLRLVLVLFLAEPLYRYWQRRVRPALQRLTTAFPTPLCASGHKSAATFQPMTGSHQRISRALIFPS